MMEADVLKTSGVVIGSDRDVKSTSSNKLCIKDENGRVFHIQSFNVITDTRKFHEERIQLFG